MKHLASFTASAPTIESLESRIAPAGVIDIQFTPSGELLVKSNKASDGNETFAVRLDADSVTFSPLAGNTSEFIFGGQSQGSGTVSLPVAPKKVTIRMGGGNDVVELSSTSNLARPVFVDLGDGDDRLRIGEDGGEFGASVKIVGGKGINVTSFSDTRIVGNVTIQGGEDSDRIELTDGVRFLKNFNANLGNGGNSLLAFASVEVGENLAITGGKNGDVFSFQASAIDVGGDLVIRTGAGPDQINLLAGASLSVGDDLKLQSLGGASSHVVSAGQLSVGGDVASHLLLGGSGRMELISSNQSAAIAGDVKLLGAERVVMRMAGAVEGSVNIVTAGTSPFAVEIGVSTAELSIGEKLAITLKGATAAGITLETVEAIGGIVIRGRAELL